MNVAATALRWARSYFLMPPAARHYGVALSKKPAFNLARDMVSAGTNVDRNSLLLPFVYCIIQRARPTSRKPLDVPAGLWIQFYTHKIRTTGQHASSSLAISWASSRSRPPLYHQPQPSGGRERKWSCRRLCIYLRRAGGLVCQACLVPSKLRRRQPTCRLEYFGSDVWSNCHSRAAIPFWYGGRRRRRN